MNSQVRKLNSSSSLGNAETPQAMKSPETLASHRLPKVFTRQQASFTTDKQTTDQDYSARGSLYLKVVKRPGLSSSVKRPALQNRDPEGFSNLYFSKGAVNQLSGSRDSSADHSLQSTTKGGSSKQVSAQDLAQRIYMNPDKVMRLQVKKFRQANFTSDVEQRVQKALARRGAATSNRRYHKIESLANSVEASQNDPFKKQFPNQFPGPKQFTFNDTFFKLEDQQCEPFQEQRRSQTGAPSFPTPKPNDQADHCPYFTAPTLDKNGSSNSGHESGSATLRSYSREILAGDADVSKNWPSIFDKNVHPSGASSIDQISPSNHPSTQPSHLETQLKDKMFTLPKIGSETLKTARQTKPEYPSPGPVKSNEVKSEQVYQDSRVSPPPMKRLNESLQFTEISEEAEHLQPPSKKRGPFLKGQSPMRKSRADKKKKPKRYVDHFASYLESKVQSKRGRNKKSTEQDSILLSSNLHNTSSRSITKALKQSSTGLGESSQDRIQASLIETAQSSKSVFQNSSRLEPKSAQAFPADIAQTQNLQFAPSQEILFEEPKNSDSGPIHLAQADSRNDNPSLTYNSVILNTDEDSQGNPLDSHTVSRDNISKALLVKGRQSVGLRQKQQTTGAKSRKPQNILFKFGAKTSRDFKNLTSQPSQQVYAGITITSRASGAKQGDSASVEGATGGGIPIQARNPSQNEFVSLASLQQRQQMDYDDFNDSLAKSQILNCGKAPLPALKPSLSKAVSKKQYNSVARGRPSKQLLASSPQLRLKKQSSPGRSSDGPSIQISQRERQINKKRIEEFIKSQKQLMQSSTGLSQKRLPDQPTSSLHPVILKSSAKFIEQFIGQQPRGGRRSPSPVNHFRGQKIKGGESLRLMMIKNIRRRVVPMVAFTGDPTERQNSNLPASLQLCQQASKVSKVETEKLTDRQDSTLTAGEI